MSNKTIKKTGFLSGALIWIMLILIPCLGAKYIFLESLKMEASLIDSVQRQKLGLEIQRYNYELNESGFLLSALGITEIAINIEKHYKGLDVSGFFNSHPLLKDLQNRSLSQKQLLEKIISGCLNLTGTKPDFVYLLDPDPENCHWFLNTPFKLKCDENLFRKQMSLAHKTLAFRNFALRDIAMKGIPEDQLSVRLPPVLEGSPELSSSLGSFDLLNNSIGFISQRYSYAVNDLLFTIGIPVRLEKNDFKMAIIGVSCNRIPIKKLLKVTSERLSSGIFYHTTEMIDEKIVLPAFFEDSDNLSIISRFPESFYKHEARLRTRSGKMPIIKVSCKNPIKIRNEKSEKINLIILFYAVSMSFLMLAMLFGKLTFSKNLAGIVTAGIFAGILLPLSGAISLGICYLNTQKQLKAESILDFMQEKVFEKEQAINLQKARNLNFHSIFAKYISGLTREELINLPPKLGFFIPDQREKTTEADEQKNYLFNRRFTAFLNFNNMMETLIGLFRINFQLSETVQPFFAGKARETLHLLGAYANIPQQQINQMLQVSQLTQGLIDKAIDRRLFIRAFANEQATVVNTIATGLSFLNCIFWKDKSLKIFGLSVLQFERRSWNHDLDDFMVDRRIQRVFRHLDFDIFVNIFDINSYHENQLHKPNILKIPVGRFSMEFFWQQAQTLCAFSRQVRLNNINSENPYLINASVASENQYYIMAYAVPAETSFRFSEEHILVLLSLLAVISSLILSRSMAWALIRTMPAFLTAINELKQQNFMWQLELNSGDEFDKLAEAFNVMSIKLHEKEKLSRLVSRNVLDAISSTDEQLLKPGGSRVKAAILSSDIRNFTSITEDHPAAEVVEMLNDYFTVMTECIEKHGGIIDKLIGDAIQAVFYDHECENCSQSAVMAAIDMREALKSLNKKRNLNKAFEIENGVGICTGSLICGRIGSESGKLDATIIGNLVNRAAEIEALSKHGKFRKILIDEETAAKLTSEILIERHRVKNQIEIIEII